MQGAQNSDDEERTFPRPLNAVGESTQLQRCLGSLELLEKEKVGKFGKK